MEGKRVIWEGSFKGIRKDIENILTKAVPEALTFPYYVLLKWHKWICVIRTLNNVLRNI